MAEVSNKNMLSPVGFSFQLKRAPNFNFFVQSISTPSITLGNTDMPTPFKALPVYGDHIVNTDFDVTFKVNENLSNYAEINKWIRGISFPTSFDEFKELEDAPTYTGESLESDATLTVYSSSMNPIAIIEFEDIFPISLSQIELNTQDASLEYVSATVSFRCKDFTIKILD